MPPEKPRTGKYVELDDGLLAEFAEMCRRNGTTFRFELEDAMRRHLAYPPVRAPEPLPPHTDPPKKRGKK